MRPLFDAFPFPFYPPDQRGSEVLLVNDFSFYKDFPVGTDSLQNGVGAAVPIARSTASFVPVFFFFVFNPFSMIDPSFTLEDFQDSESIPS